MNKKKKQRLKIALKNRIRKKARPKRDITTYNYKIGNRTIKLTVEKIEEEKRSGLTDSIFYQTCVFCNKDFGPQDQNCPECGQPLARVNLKKCEFCGAKNKPARRNCWVCNGNFPGMEESVEKITRTILTLNINNHLFRNTDKILGLGMRKLFDDLIASNFSKEPLEAWLKFYEEEEEFKREMAREQCRRLKDEYRQKSIMYTLFSLLIVVIFLTLLAVFWTK